MNMCRLKKSLLFLGLTAFITGECEELLDDLCPLTHGELAEAPTKDLAHVLTRTTVNDNFETPQAHTFLYDDAFFLRGTRLVPEVHSIYASTLLSVTSLKSYKAGGARAEASGIPRHIDPFLYIFGYRSNSGEKKISFYDASGHEVDTCQTDKESDVLDAPYTKLIEAVQFTAIPGNDKGQLVTRSVDGGTTLWNIELGWNKEHTQPCVKGTPLWHIPTALVRWSAPDKEETPLSAPLCADDASGIWALDYRKMHLTGPWKSGIQITDILHDKVRPDVLFIAVSDGRFLTLKINLMPPRCKFIRQQQLRRPIDKILMQRSADEVILLHRNSLGHSRMDSEQPWLTLVASSARVIDANLVHRDIWGDRAVIITPDHAVNAEDAHSDEERRTPHLLLHFFEFGDTELAAPTSSFGFGNLLRKIVTATPIIVAVLGVAFFQVTRLNRKHEAASVSDIAERLSGPDYGSGLDDRRAELRRRGLVGAVPFTSNLTPDFRRAIRREMRRSNGPAKGGPLASVEESHVEREELLESSNAESFQESSNLERRSHAENHEDSSTMD